MNNISEIGEEHARRILEDSGNLELFLACVEDVRDSKGESETEIILAQIDVIKEYKRIMGEALNGTDMRYVIKYALQSKRITVYVAMRTLLAVYCEQAPLFKDCMPEIRSKAALDASQFQ